MSISVLIAAKSLRCPRLCPIRRREPAAPHHHHIAALPRARLRYVPPDPKIVDLSFAGRLKLGDPSLKAIAAALPGDPVHLIRDSDRWRIEDALGQTLSRLSRAFTTPDDTTFLRGEIAAILNWRRDDGDEEYHHLLRRNEREVVLPELVFEAGADSVRAV